LLVTTHVHKAIIEAVATVHSSKFIHFINVKITVMPLKLFKETGFIISILIIIITHLACKKDTCEDCITNQPPRQQPVDSSRWVGLGNLPDEFFLWPDIEVNTENFLLGIERELFAISRKGNLWLYNTGANTWSHVGSFSEDFGSAPVTFSIYGMGYCIGNGHCWQFNPATNQLTRKQDPPFYPIDAPLVIGHKAYLRTGDSNHLYAYDPAIDTYTQQNDPPDFGNNLYLLGYFVINDRGYYVGAYGDCWRYDASLDQWQRRTSFPGMDPVYHAYAGVGFSLNNRGYLLNLNGVARHLWQYDASLDKWTITNDDYHGSGFKRVQAVSLDSVDYIGLGSNDDLMP
jgi:hypothetical protein